MRRILVAALSISTTVACQPHAAATSSEPKPAPNELWVTPEQLERSRVVVAAVEEQPIDDALVSSGKVAFDDGRVSHVISPIAGRVTRIDAALGQHVAKGGSLALIQSPDLGSASSDVGKADADLVTAERAYRRQKYLFDRGAGTQTDLDTADDTFRKARAELERSKERAGLMGAGSTVTQAFVLRSSIDGYVVARAATPGMELQNQYTTGGAPELFTVGTIDHVWILADVYEMNAPRVTLGAAVDVVVVGLPNRVFAGVVDYVGTVLDPQSRTLKVRCVLANPDHLLKPEMYATVTIHVSPRVGLVVPRTAVVRLGGQALVFVDKGEAPVRGKERFVRAPVEIDERSADGLVPVLRGLARGDRVAVSGVQILSSLSTPQ